MGTEAPEEQVVIEELQSEDFKGEEQQKEPENAIQASREKAKELSYYHAQGTPQPLPEDTVIREADPLFRADGQGPHKIEPQQQQAPAQNVRWMESYSFADGDKAVKLYVEFPESLADADISAEWERFGVEVLARLPSGTNYGIKIRDREGWVLEHERSGGFAHEIDPQKCKHRLSSNGQRITLTVAKLDDKEKWHELKKKDIKSTMPR